MLTVKDLTWGYLHAKHLFDAFNFALYDNDFSVVMGESWTGKSTLVKLLTWHITAPAKSIYHKLEDLSKYSSSELQAFRKKLGVVFQRDYLIKTLSIKENILYSLKLQGVDYRQWEGKYRDIVKYLNIKHLEGKSLERLSSGEVQKIFIARALIHAPECIIIDDALTNLDKKSREQILDLLIKYHHDGHTILLITHDHATVDYLKQHIEIMLTEL